MKQVLFVAVVALVAGGLIFTLYIEKPSDAGSSISTSTASSTASISEEIQTVTTNSARFGPHVRIGDTDVKVTVADTPEERMQGLSGRAALARDEGMLFVFEQDGLYSFWMKDMKFPIDMIWLSSSGKVVHIVENATPDSYPASFSPPDEARYVLEVNAGFTKAHNIAVGAIAGISR